MTPGSPLRTLAARERLDDDDISDVSEMADGAEAVDGGVLVETHCSP